MQPNSVESPASASPQPERRTLTLFLALCFAASLIWAVWSASGNWNSPNISDEHGFRQAQTAITAWYLREGGSFLRYETPVLGPPWSIPFEFPLYQWLVARVSGLFHLDLAPAGRAVSMLFFAGTLLGVWALLSEMRVARAHRFVFLTLLLVSPEYLFWSRTFMIESTAVCFCMLYLWLTLRYLRLRSPFVLVAAVLCGVVGALVKATTFPGFGLLVACACTADALRRRRPSGDNDAPPATSRPSMLLTLLAGALLLATPVFVTAAWTRYADSVKEQNILARDFITSAALRDWNFGTLEQRFQIETWSHIAEVNLTDLIGGMAVAVAVALGLLGVRSSHRRLALITLAGYLVSAFLFTNLYFVHNYYAYGSGLFVVGAVAWTIVGLLESPSQRARWAGAALLAFSAVSAGFTYWNGYRLLQFSPKQYATEIAGLVGPVCPPGTVLVGYGLDWSAEVPYYAERRALLFHNRYCFDEKGNFVFNQTQEQAFASLTHDHKVGALVLFAPYSNPDLGKFLAPKLGLPPTPVFANKVCLIYSASSPRPSADGAANNTAP